MDAEGAPGQDPVAKGGNAMRPFRNPCKSVVVGRPLGSPNVKGIYSPNPGALKQRMKRARKGDNMARRLDMSVGSTSPDM